jgi:thiamine pyrophosphokinase
MTVTWNELDKGTERLILVGPALRNPLPLSLPGLEGVPQLAVDGGAGFAFNPVLWAGDGDSGKVPDSIPAFIKHSQQITDLRFCLDGIRVWRWKELHLFGFLGGRRDHEFANFGEIHAEMKKRAAFSKAVFYSEDVRARVLFLGEGEHDIELHGTFSTLAVEPAEITLAGECRYKVENALLPPLSGKGISNEASGMVKISSTGPVILLCNL